MNISTDSKVSHTYVAIIIVLVVLLGSVSGFALAEYGKLEHNTQVDGEANQTYPLVNNICTQSECLFDAGENGVIGTTIITGYYSLMKETYYDREIECPSFVITGGSQPLISMLLAWIAQGNTVNYRNDLNQPIVKINLATMSSEQKAPLLNSSLTAPVSFKVFRPMPQGKGAGACHAVLEFLTPVSQN